MSWAERLEKAAYISPDGQIRVDFDYEVLRRTLPRKTSVYDFPDAAATYVQDLGIAGRRFPLRVILWGADYDQQAANLERAIAQRGAGTLQHPQIGPVPVVPFGEVTRRDDLTQGANQAVYEITFYETVTELYPQIVDTDAPRGQLFETLAGDFAEGAGLDSAQARARARPKVLELMRDLRAQVGPIAANVQSVSREFDRIVSGIETGIDQLLQEPADLAFSIQRAITAPVTAARRIEQTTRGYRDLILSLIDGPPSSRTDLQLRGLFSAGAVNALGVAVEAAEYQTRAEAVEAAAGLADLFDLYAAWRDQRPAGVEDLGESYGLTLDVTARSAGNVIRRAFDLAQARRVVTDRPRALVDLAFEFYGDPEAVNRAINENELTGSEILTIPGGRSLVYYI